MEYKAVLKAFVSLFDKCDQEKRNVVTKSDLVKIISSSVNTLSPNIEDLVTTIIGRHDNQQVITKNEFISNIEAYIKKNQECIERCKSPVSDYELRSLQYCSQCGDNWRNERNKLESLCDDLTVQIQSIEEQNAKLSYDNQRLTFNYENLVVREKELQLLFEELQNELSRKDNRCLVLERKLSESKSCLEREKEKLQETVENLGKRWEERAASQKKLETVLKENEVFKKEIKDLAEKLELKEDEYNTLHQKSISSEAHYKNNLIECLQRIETLDMNNVEMEKELLNGRERIQELNSLNENLKMKYKVLKDTMDFKYVMNQCNSALVSFEEDSVNYDDSSDFEVLLKVSAADSGITDSHLSIREEMEAEGEHFDKFSSTYSVCGDSDLIDQINDQQKTIDSLKKLVEKEIENHKLKSETLENVENQLEESRETIDELKKEKEKIEEQWRTDRIKFSETINQLKKEIDKEERRQQPIGRFTVATSDLDMKQNIERQQMTIRKLVEKLSGSRASDSASISCPITESDKRIQPEKKCNEIGDGNDSQNVKIEDRVCLKETGSIDIASSSPKTMTSTSDSSFDYDSSSASKSSDKNQEPKNTLQIIQKKMFKVPILLFVSLVLVAMVIVWLTIQWQLKESAFSCLQVSRDGGASRSPLVDNFICPYVSFRWNELHI